MDLKMDLSFVNVLRVQTSTQRSAGPFLVLHVHAPAHSLAAHACTGQHIQAGTHTHARTLHTRALSEGRHLREAH